MNFKTKTDGWLEVRLGELLGMDKLSALTAPEYCKNWSATMPLAVEFGVCLKSPTKENKMWVAIWNEWGGIWMPNEIQVKNTNPLRAIVICLIEVLEAKNDSGQKP